MIFYNNKQLYQMDWLNLHTSVLDSPDVVGAEPVDRGTWLMLLRYCIGQENGGTIRDCADWKDRKWQQLARVTLAEVKRDSGLWRWDGTALVVTWYPLSKESEVKMKRELARENGQRGGRKKTNTGTDVGSYVGSEKEPTLVNSAKAEGEGERKEKGKEGEATAAALAERLCQAHPSRALTRPALLAAMAAIRRHPFENVMAGTVAYAAAVAAWTPAERTQFVKNPEAFFTDDVWNQPAENWKSRTEAKRINGAAGGNVREIDVGGRKPAGVMTAHLK